MNVVLAHDSALYGKTGPGTTWANEMNFIMKHAPGAGSIVLLIDQQFIHHCATDAAFGNEMNYHLHDVFIMCLLRQETY